MPIKDPDNINWTVVIYLFVITLFGSLANYCYHLMRGVPFRLSTLICQIFVAIFAGLLIFFIASYFSWQFEFACCTSGVAGWSGATLIKALEERLIKKAKGED